MAPKDRLTFRAVTRDRWPDLEELFGPRGACGGCWCMWWKLPRSEFKKGRGELREGYPVCPRRKRIPDAFAWTGLVSAFRKSGFQEVARPSPTRAIMRCWIRKDEA